MLEMLFVFMYGSMGFFAAASFGLLVGGYILYLVRMGTEARDAGIEFMEWGVTMLFVVLILAFIVRAIE